MERGRLPDPVAGQASIESIAARGTNDTLSTAEIRAAMAKKAAEFRDHGGEIYLPKTAAE